MKTKLVLASFLVFVAAVLHAEDAGGIRDVTVDEATKLLANDQQLLVLDIRTPAEFAAGKIAGATNLDFYDPGFAEGLAKLDRDKPYLVHCASGGRSGKALTQMRALGFKRVYHLSPGFKGWVAAGKPVEK